MLCDFRARPDTIQVDLKVPLVHRVYEIIQPGDVFRFQHQEVPLGPENFQVDLNVPSVWKNNG